MVEKAWQDLTEQDRIFIEQLSKIDDEEIKNEILHYIHYLDEIYLYEQAEAQKTILKKLKIVLYQQQKNKQRSVTINWMISQINNELVKIDGG